MIRNSIKIIFFGTPSFSVTILQALIDANMPPVAVVTAPDKPAGRGHHLQSPPVKKLADARHIPVLQPEKLKDELFLETLRNYAANVFVIAAYGKILPQILLDIPPKGVINIHPSLLPRHRGPSPIQGAILAGDSATGVTLMLTDKEMDHGPILAQQELEFSISSFQFQKLHDELANLGGKMIVDTLPKWIMGKITPQEQDHEKATFTKLLTKENGHIDWKKPAEEIDRMVRALNPWPGTWNYMKTVGSPTSADIAEVGLPTVRRVKILAGHQTDEPSTALPGTLIKTKSGQLAACTVKNLYVIEKLQMEGKKPTSDFSLPTPSMMF